MELLGERAGRPSDEESRKTLRKWTFVLPEPNNREVPDNVRNALDWVSKASWPLANPTEVAERVRNSGEVLLPRYAKCLDGRQDVANRYIEDLLRESE